MNNYFLAHVISLFAVVHFGMYQNFTVSSYFSDLLVSSSFCARWMMDHVLLTAASRFARVPSQLRRLLSFII